ncbi:carbohydrate-binding protein [Chitinilyticum piscinae]|uniref:Chitin-binding type-3 domain-containing protein n=1 Tax=Chitinilyticum piscinae TaxID=2866724 RepID=A0A8J7K295_9NEIS|nr:carbohydrate-binding protein [Chitinilyticum piscinae]MBE9609727.1 hypothetical protein [Chitinilyticum piscinae]
MKTTLKHGLLGIPALLVALTAHATPAMCTGTYPQLPTRPAGSEAMPIMEPAFTQFQGASTPRPTYPGLGQLFWPGEPSNSGQQWCIGVIYSTAAQLNALDDAQLQRVAAGVAPAWESSRTYNAGDQVSYNSQIYKAKWWTQNEAPGNAYGAWEQQSNGSTGPQAWDSTRVYNTGDEAVFRASLYRAKWWTQGNQPGEDWGPWTLLGVAPATAPRPAGYQLQLIPGDSGLRLNYLSKPSFETVNYTVDAQCKVNAQSSWSNDNGSNTPPQKLEVLRDGQLIASISGNQFLTGLPRPIPPKPLLETLQAQVRNDDGSCRYADGALLLSWSGDTGASVSASIVLPAQSNSNFLSARACNSDSCRSTPLLWESALGGGGKRVLGY